MSEFTTFCLFTVFSACPAANKTDKFMLNNKWNAPTVKGPIYFLLHSVAFSHFKEQTLMVLASDYLATQMLIPQNFAARNMATPQTVTDHSTIIASQNILRFSWPNSNCRRERGVGRIRQPSATKLRHRPI